MKKLASQVQNSDEVKAYTLDAKKKTEIERTNDTKEKTGVLLAGIHAINPATKEEIPVYIADYVLAHYGTGAIMAVPAHDERDYAFAQKFKLPIKEVVAEQASPRRAGGVSRHAVHAIVEDGEGNILLQEKNTTAHGRIACLPGGGIDEEEDEVTALKREPRRRNWLYGIQ